MICEIRKMKDKDLDITLEWLTHPTVRAMARDDSIICKEEHVAVFKYSTSAFLIFEVEGKRRGYVRITLDPEDKSGEWSFLIAPESRGKGLSPIMLRMALLEAKKLGYSKIVSSVKKVNRASMYLHDELGFQFTKEDEVFVSYERELK